MRGFELPRDLRPKNAYNLLRLIGTAVQWLKTGSPTFEVVGGFRDRLLAIKTGDVSLADVLKDAEAMTPELEAARHTTRLPPHPDVGRADALLRRIGEEIARRFIVRDPGPFGKNAIAPPPVSWEDSR